MLRDRSEGRLRGRQVCRDALAPLFGVEAFDRELGGCLNGCRANDGRRVPVRWALKKEGHEWQFDWYHAMDRFAVGGADGSRQQVERNLAGQCGSPAGVEGVGIAATRARVAVEEAFANPLIHSISLEAVAAF